MTKTTILIADDDRVLLNTLTVRLRAAGYEVLCTQDGCQAVAAARKHSPDLILLDIDMPGGDGFTVHERVRKLAKTKNTPVVYLTGRRSADLHEIIRNTSAFALIRKPFETDDLLGVIAGALNQAATVKGTEATLASPPVPPFGDEPA